jgi:peroxiredoxin
MGYLFAKLFVSFLGGVAKVVPPDADELKSWTTGGTGFRNGQLPEGSFVIRKTVFYTAMMVMALSLLAVAGCGGDSENNGSSTANTDQQAQAAVPAVFGKGSPAPDFTLKKINGGELQLSSLRGKAVIIDFWDTWCGPCRVSMPHFQALSQQYADDLVVVGVALGREGEDKVRKFAQDRGLTFEMVLFNNDPALIQGFGGIQSIPTTFLVDGEGIIREVWIGGHGKAEYERGVKAVIGS